MNINKLIQIAHKIIILKLIPEQNLKFDSREVSWAALGPSSPWTSWPPPRTVSERRTCSWDRFGRDNPGTSLECSRDLPTQGRPPLCHQPDWNKQAQRYSHILRLVSWQTDFWLHPSFPSLCFPIIVVNFSSAKQFKLLQGQRSNRATFWLTCTKLKIYFRKVVINDLIALDSLLQYVRHEIMKFWSLRTWYSATKPAYDHHEEISQILINSYKLSYFYFTCSWLQLTPEWRGSPTRPPQRRERWCPPCGGSWPSRWSPPWSALCARPSL